MAPIFGRIVGGRLHRLAFSALLVTSILSSEAVYAREAQNCNLDSSQIFNADPLTQAQLQAAANAAANARFGSDPAFKYLTNLGNTTSASPSQGALGTGLSGTEASTSIATELIAQRRVQELQICPAGMERVGGICRPLRRAAVDAPSQPRSGARTPGSPSAKPSSTRPTSTRHLPDAPIPSDPIVQPTAAIWSQAFYDYERRTGLQGASGPGSRSQVTYGAVVGADRTFRAGDTQLVLGVLGSVSKTNQAFSPQTSNVAQNTTFNVDFTNDPLFAPADRDIYSYTFPVNHSITSQERQQLSGAGGGLTASISRGGWFSDSLFKFDFLNLTRTGTSSDTRPTVLNINRAQFSGPQVGCINVVSNPDAPPGSFITPYTLNGIQTTFSTSIQSTTAANFVLSEMLGYHFDLRSGFWWEPLVGGTYTYSTYGSNAAALGLQDGQNLRIQGGARLGLTHWTTNGGAWTTSVTQLVYSDVFIRGFVTNADGFSAGYLLADQGKVRFQSILTSKFDMANGLSFFLECQGRFGNEYLAYGGRAGARYEF